MDQLLNTGPCGYVFFQDDGSVISLNQTLADLLEVRKEELDGRSIESMLTVASRIFYNTHLFPLLKLHGKAEEIFISLRGKNRKDVPVLLSGQRQQTQDGYVNFFMMMPIHQRKKFEDELLAAKRNAEKAVRENEQLNALTKSLAAQSDELHENNALLRLMGQDLLQFSRVISHDLQEALHKINVFTDKLTIDEAERLSGAGKLTAAKILDAAKKGDALIHGLQEIIQVSTVLERNRVDLNAVVRSAQAKAVKETGYTSAEFVLTMLPDVDGSADQLELAFYHLLLNAIQYRKPNGRLLIALESVLQKENKYRHTKDRYAYTDHIKLVVKDNGIGFDPAQNEYIFGLFKKANHASPSLGIGLSLVRKIIENHGGTIHANGQPGTGTEITIILPCRASEVNAN